MFFILIFLSASSPSLLLDHDFGLELLLLLRIVSNCVMCRKAELLEIFEKIDKDKSGKISAEELFTVLLPFQFSEQQIRDMMSLHDVDQDGYLEFEEFVKFWK